jgi:hypothetical protein
MMRYSLIILLLGLLGCVQDFNPSALSGIYHYAEGNIKQEIRIEPAGMYTNSLQQNGVEIWNEKNTWVLGKNHDRSRVIFSNFKFGIPLVTEVKGFWSVEPEKSLLGVKKLCFDNDLNRCFVSN